MLKVLFVLLSLIIYSLPSAAESRFFTIQTGVPAIYTNLGTPTFGAYSSCDPFIMKVDGIKYYMMYNSSSGYTYKNLLGCSGQKNSLFEPLYNLESDGDNSKLTGEELESAGVRFVKVKNNGYLDVNNKSSDFGIKKISYIDLSRLRISTGPRPYGNFDVYVKKENGSLKKVISRTTMHTLHYVKSLFD